MKKLTVVLFGAIILAGGMVSTSTAMRGLLEKKIWYIHQGTTGEATHWAIYFGDFDCSLIRKYPGEDSLPVDASLNISLLSNGYIEANGYSAKGKIEADVHLAIRRDNKLTQVDMGEVACIYDYGRKIRLKDGTEGEFVLDVETSPFEARKMMLRKYKFEEVWGEKVLKEDAENTDLILSAAAFTKEGLKYAQEQVKE